QRADVYALGVTLCVALGGGASEGGIDLASLRARRTDLNEELLTILERATARRKEDRYATAGEFLRALTAHQGRRYPLFTDASLAELVQARAIARPEKDLEKPATLVSIRGTATHLAPVAFTGEQDRFLQPTTPARGAFQSGGGTRRVGSAQRPMAISPEK